MGARGRRAAARPLTDARGIILVGLRPALLVLATLLAAPPVRAEDARVTFLARQLKTAKDARVRAQTVLILGQTGSPEAVAPLCEALKDREPVVRSAAAGALAEVKGPGALDCLKAALSELDATVKTAIEKAIATLTAPTPVVGTGALYVNLEPIQDKVGSLSEAALALTEKLLRDRLTGLGASFAPANEDKKAAAALIKLKNLRGYQLRLQLLPGATPTGLKAEMLIMTYPDQSLKGSWQVKAAGGKPEAQIKALVPRLVDDAANDLEWKR